MNTQKIVIECICIATMLLLFGCASDTKQKNGEPVTPPDGERVQRNETIPQYFRYETDPASVFQTVETPDSIADDLKHESVIGYVYIKFNNRMWRPDRMDAGDIILLHLPDDLKLEAEIRRIRRNEDLVSITAEVLEPHHGFVSLTQEKDRTVGTIELYSEKRTFHIRYDRYNDMIYFAEVDPTKLDVLPGSPPLEPPLNGYNFYSVKAAVFL